MAIEMMNISTYYCLDYMTRPTQFGDEPLFFYRYLTSHFVWNERNSPIFFDSFLIKIIQHTIAMFSSEKAQRMRDKKFGFSNKNLKKTKSFLCYIIFFYLCNSKELHIK